MWNELNRRDLITHLYSLGNMAVAATKADPPPRLLKMIVTGGHPGDPEYGCGGTIARFTDLGHEVVLLYLNEGVPPKAKPRDGFRIAEARKSCEILKARPLFAGQIDGEAVVDRPTTRRSARFSRGEQPDVVLPTGRSTTTPTIARSRCWSMTPG